MTARVTPEPGFRRALKKLPPDRAEAAIATLEKFMEEPALPRLDFRPLRGKAGYFLINARRGDRIILRRDADHLTRRSMSGRTTTSTGAGTDRS